MRKRLRRPAFTAGEKRIALALAGYFTGVFFANLVLPFAAAVVGIVAVVIYTAVGIQNRKGKANQ